MIDNNNADEWVILRLRSGDYKLFRVVLGGYLTGDYWSLNSGIQKVEQDDNFYYFTGFSGSVYNCIKNRYGIESSYGLSVLSEILRVSKGNIELVEVLEEYLKTILIEDKD